MFKRPIVIGLSPNTEVDDYIIALKTLVSPWRWFSGQAVSEVEDWFKNYFRATEAIAFNAGRSALLAILKSLDLPGGCEILIQAFTCVAVPNCIVWAGLKPIFVDVDRSLNLDVADAENKMGVKTKVLIVQHTFGIPADMDKIGAFCKKYNLILIEDCAHSLGATYKQKAVGTFGDAAFFSFGRDKIVSSVFGGMAILNPKSKIQNQKLLEIYKNLQYPSVYWVIQQLLHPLISFVVLYTYNFFQLGKVILKLSQKLRLLSFPVYEKEKLGKQPINFPKKYPFVLAELLKVQLNKLGTYNKKRRQIAKYYTENLARLNFKLPVQQAGSVYLRYNILTDRADEWRYRFKKLGIVLGNWYSNIVGPKGVELEKIGYKSGSCPNAEKFASQSLNLPTYPTLTKEQVLKICSILRK